tara:strand:+ start:180 stop:359 length:180 start_codon:yes stop_codon:yes gene_type:complete
MAKAHRSDILGEWARENGFEHWARAFHPQEVAKRRQHAIKRWHEDQRRKREKEERGGRR